MKYVPNAVTRQVGRAVLSSRTHSPAILFGAGVIGVVGTVVLACRATLNLEDLLVDAEKTTQDIKSLPITEKDRRKDLTYHYVATTGRLMKLYGPSVMVGSLSVAALTGSHRILTTRNAGLTAAYATIEKAFGQYRGRVVADQGEDKDREYRYGAETREVVIDTDKGAKVKNIKTVGPGKDMSGYAKFFDQFNPNWEPNAELNLYFLKCAQNYANDRLRAKGWVLLNEVYKSIGLEETSAGCVVGWRMTKESVGDNYIDFGIWDPENGMARDFVNGREKAILLDFNVDGTIYDKIEG